MLPKLVCTLSLLSVALGGSGTAVVCKDIGGQKVFYDPSCSVSGQSHTGCNAGGEGQNCRFCSAAPEKCRSTPARPSTPATSPGPQPSTTRFTGSTTTTTPYNPANMTLIFAEEFDTLNFQTWQHELTLAGGGNWEFEWYVNNRSNSFVKDGVLHIRPTLTADYMDLMDAVDFNGGAPADQCTDPQFYGCKRDPKASGNVMNPVRSARLRSVNGFNFRYGRVEIRAQLPKGDWLWPAIWMLPADDEYGPWPASGEVDIVESRGNDPSYAAGGRDQFGTTLHFGPNYDQDPWSTAHATYNLPSGDFSDGFRTFGLIWTDKFIKSYVDTESNVVLNVDCSEQSIWERGKFPSSYDNPWKYSGNKCAPFDKKFYFLLNLAVGGTSNYFPDGVGSKPWSNTASNSVNQFWNAKGQWAPTWDLVGDGSSLKVDWIRVWQ